MSQSKTKLPDWYTDFMKRNLQAADLAAQIGYTPYMGPDVAAFTPQQKAAFQSANDWSKAFGGPTAKISEPTVQKYAGGLRGYSSYPGYQDTMNQFAQQYPGQAAAIKSFSLNPQTGDWSPVYKNLIRDVGDDRAGWAGFDFYKRGNPPWFQAGQQQGGGGQQPTQQPPPQVNPPPNPNPYYLGNPYQYPNNPLYYPYNRGSGWQGGTGPHGA